MEGYIHSVSPQMQSKNNTYFTATIQTDKGEYRKVVVFVMEKHNIFTQAEKNGKALRLQKTMQGKTSDDIICNDLTTVEECRVTFLRCVPPSSKTMSIEEVKELNPKQTVGEIHGKVEDNGSLSKTVTVNGSDCELKEVWICDGTGKIKITLWGDHGNKVEAMKSYAFKNVCTRERGGCIYLTTSPSTTVEQTAPVEVTEVEGNHEDVTSMMPLSNRIKITVQWCCPNCHLEQESQEKIHRCNSCRQKQLTLSLPLPLREQSTVEINGFLLSIQKVDDQVGLSDEANSAS